VSVAESTSFVARGRVASPIVQLETDHVWLSGYLWVMQRYRKGCHRSVRCSTIAERGELVSLTKRPS
jgi:hypothetical protein